MEWKDAAVQDRADFGEFAMSVRAKVETALVARHGPDVAIDATADAIEYAWRHWDRIRGMANPAGYVYRVAQSRCRRYFARRVHFPTPDSVGVPWIEPRLPSVLAELTKRQREVVVLRHAYEWTLAEIAELLGISITSVQNHAERGMAKLRTQLDADHV